MATSTLEALPPIPYVTAEDVAHRAKQLLELEVLTADHEISDHFFGREFAKLEERSGETEVSRAMRARHPTTVLPDYKAAIVAEYDTNPAIRLYGALSFGLRHMFEAEVMAVGIPSDTTDDFHDRMRRAILTTFPALAKQALDATGTTLSPDGSCSEDLETAFTMLSYRYGLDTPPEAEPDGFMTDGGWVPVHIEGRYPAFFASALDAASRLDTDTR